MAYARTLSRVETYFDRTATETWARLTSDAPVSKIRATVRAGRDQMRATMLSRLPDDLRDARILDAGCGTGLATAELAERGASVVAVDISPTLIDIARERLSPTLGQRVAFVAGDMLADDLGRFDHVIAMDSLIYYRLPDILSSIGGLAERTSGKVIFTIAPKTAPLMAMWYAGKLFPRSDRSPVMIPHSANALTRAYDGSGRLHTGARVTSGFYISQAMEVSA